jgi:tetratricopeptide (TPR) repeat protein
MKPLQRQVPADASPESRRLEAALARAREATAAFDARASLQAAADAIRLARHLQDPGAEAEALLLATTCHYQRGDYVACVATGIDACATFRDNDLAGRAHAFAGVALAFFSVRDYRRAEEAGRRAIRYAATERDSPREATARSTLAFVLADGGRYEEALEELRRARRRFRQAGDRVRMKKSSSNTGHALRKQGLALSAAHDPEGARRSWRRATRWYRVALGIGKSRLDDAIIHGALGECLLLLGRAAEGLEHVRTAEAMMQPRDAPPVVASLALWRGECERALGRHDDAERSLQAALAEADALDNDEVSVDARKAMAKLHQDRGDVVRARHWLREAREIGEKQQASLAEFRRQMRPLWDRFLRAGD